MGKLNDKGNSDAVYGSINMKWSDYSFPKNIWCGNEDSDYEIQNTYMKYKIRAWTHM